VPERPAELSVSLWRGGAEGRYETYRVPRRDSQTVLDVVTYVQRHIDPTLSYRFACRVGMCGSCAMTVNGRPRWTYRTHVAKVAGSGRLEIGPLENLPAIKDLTADMAPFFEKWREAKGAFAPSRTRTDAMPRIRPGSAARIAADAAIECINCASVTPPATRCAGTPIISAPPRSTGPGRSSTTSAMPAMARGSRRSPPPAAECATPRTPRHEVPRAPTIAPHAPCVGRLTPHGGASSGPTLLSIDSGAVLRPRNDSLGFAEPSDSVALCTAEQHGCWMAEKGQWGDFATFPACPVFS
jgi:hypothetical protein